MGRSVSSEKNPPHPHRFLLPVYVWVVLLILLVAAILLTPKPTYGAVGDGGVFGALVGDMYRAMWSIPDIVAWGCGFAGVLLVTRGIGKLREMNDDEPNDVLVRSARVLIVTGVAFLGIFGVAMFLLHSNPLLQTPAPLRKAPPEKIMIGPAVLNRPSPSAR